MGGSKGCVWTLVRTDLFTRIAFFLLRASISFFFSFLRALRVSGVFFQPFLLAFNYFGLSCVLGSQRAKLSDWFLVLLFALTR